MDGWMGGSMDPIPPPLNIRKDDISNNTRLPEPLSSIFHSTIPHL